MKSPSKKSKDRGVELTPETEELSKRFINGEISE